jgi:colanic acid/amylovoran biosynthesis glycosyltransferase
MRLAYLTSEYPAISHTFIMREVQELRRRGFHIETFSVRPASASGVITDDDREELAHTTALLEKPYTRLLRNNVSAAVRHPGRYLKAARTAMKLRTKGASGVAKWAGYFAEGVALGRELERRGIDHVHNHFANASANVALLASKYSGIPFSFTLHGMFELEWPGVGALDDKVAEAAFLTTICDFNRSQAYRLTPTDDWSKVHVARCGLELSQFPRKPPGPRRDGPLRILSVARLSKEKGIPGLVEAFATIRERGLDAELHLVGDGPERENIERAIRERGLESRVILHGRQAGDAVRAAFADADIFALPSLMEGLPIVLMESMAIGTPVIAPTIAGIPELVIHDETGLLFAAGNWEELADRLERLARDEALRQRLTDAGRKKVEAQHDIRRAVAPLVVLFGGQPDDEQPG